MGRLPDSAADETKLELIGGALGLDFVNTVDPRHGPARREYLTDYAKLVSWAVHAGGLDRTGAAALRSAARRDPDAAGRICRDAIALREHAYAIFHAVAHGVPAPTRSLVAFNRHFARAMASRRVVVRGGSARWGWAEGGELERVLWPVVLSMAEVLVEAADDIRECPGDGTCGWLFVDRTRNRSRRWCSMENCGNRAKARRYYRRYAHASSRTST